MLLWSQPRSRRRAWPAIVFDSWQSFFVLARCLGSGAARRRLVDAHDAHGIGLIDQHAGLAGALAVIVHAPVRAMAETAGLTDHKIGGHEARFQAVKVFNLSAHMSIHLAVYRSLNAKLATLGGPQRAIGHWLRRILAPLTVQPLAHPVVKVRPQRTQAPRQCQPLGPSGSGSLQGAAMLGRPGQGRIAHHESCAQADGLGMQAVDLRSLRPQQFAAAQLRLAVGAQQRAVFTDELLHIVRQGVHG